MLKLKLGFALLLLLLGGSWTATAVPAPPLVNSPLLDSTEKPRCLSSLFGGLFDPPVVDAPQLPDFPTPYQGAGFGGLQGGVLSTPGGLDFGGTPAGLGIPSHFAPGLGQASQVYKQSQGLESQLYGAQSHINAQLAGIPNSGIPLSSGYLRSVGGSMGEVTYLPPPPSLYYR